MRYQPQRLASYFNGPVVFDVSPKNFGAVHSAIFSLLIMCMWGYSISVYCLVYFVCRSVLQFRLVSLFEKIFRNLKNLHILEKQIICPEKNLFLNFVHKFQKTLRITNFVCFISENVRKFKIFTFSDFVHKPKKICFPVLIFFYKFRKFSCFKICSQIKKN